MVVVFGAVFAWCSFRGLVRAVLGAATFATKPPPHISLPQQTTVFTHIPLQIINMGFRIGRSIKKIGRKFDKHVIQKTLYETGIKQKKTTTSTQVTTAQTKKRVDGKIKVSAPNPVGNKPQVGGNQARDDGRVGSFN